VGIQRKTKTKLHETHHFAERSKSLVVKKRVVVVVDEHLNNGFVRFGRDNKNEQCKSNGASKYSRRGEMT
jgi:hypothetical protein